MIKQKVFVLVVALAVVLTACKSPAPETTSEPTKDPNAVMTAAANTASARLTDIAALTPTALPATPTETPVPATPTLAATTAAPQASPTTAPVTGQDQAAYVSDVTVPDGTNFQPGEQFTKTWRIANTGTSTWTTAYKLAWVDGNQMGGPASVAVPSQVGPGQNVDISVNLTAPATAGKYTGYWKMMNASGALFDSLVYVEINVGGATAAAGTGTPAVTGTPGPSPTTGSNPPTATQAANVVTGAALGVDQGEVSGTCPHTYLFTAQITLSQAANVTYRLEAETGFDLTLPGPATTALNAGVNVMSYQLEFADNVSGWARLRVTSPNEVVSNQVNFTLTCP
ncbi:MAG TPA: NBR1-Ig-like domain-containing protein [Anaerolineales bacterium]|nr:NBR1-Ig-like domain-containing protein [Anaerolineales bacterium]